VAIRIEALISATALQTNSLIGNWLRSISLNRRDVLSCNKQRLFGYPERVDLSKD